MIHTNQDTKTKKGLYIKHTCILDIVLDFGFEYDPDENKYYNKDKSLCVDKETRLLYSLKKCDLTVVVKMYKLNILDIE